MTKFIIIVVMVMVEGKTIMLGKLCQWLKKLRSNLGGREGTRTIPEVSRELEREPESKTSEFQDGDLEFLFNQLLEGVINGWQDYRVERFFHKLQDRISIEQWLQWLKRFEKKLLSSPAPNHQLAGKMIALGEVTTSSPFILIRSVGDLARRIGEELLHRSNEPFAVGAHHSPIPPDERQLPSPEILEESSLKEETPPPEGQETSNLDFIIDKLIEQQETPTAEVEQRLENWFNLGLQKAQAGDLEGAIASWERLLEQAPHIAQAWHNRGSALAYLDRLEEAIASFERAIALNGNDYQSWNDRGNALYNLQRWEEALTSWDRVVSIKPDHYQAWYNRGLALEKLKLRPEALESYERALAIEPKFNLAQNRKNKLLANHEPSLERSNPSHEC